MAEEDKRTFWWYAAELGKTLAITAVGFTPEILKLFPEHTVAFKLAIPIGFAVQMFRNRIKYEKNNLPSGVTKHFDKIPNSITGIKGSKQK